MLKVSILMPTYNDDYYIREAIESLLSQSLRTFELLIMDDGSTDTTEKTINSYNDTRIRYFKQKNLGQLKALFHLVPHISGDFVTILHSDDRLSRHNVVEDILHLIDEEKRPCLYCELKKIDENGNNTGRLRIKDNLDPADLIKYAIRKGSNIIPDIFFCTRSFFMEHVFKDYIIWNIPYWLNCQQNDLAKICRSPFSWYDYRVYEKNYIHSDLGKKEVFQGNLRGVITVLKKYKPIWPNLQRRVSWVFPRYSPYALKKNGIDLVPNLMLQMLRSYWPDNEWQKNQYLRVLYDFWIKKRHVSRCFNVRESDLPPDSEHFYGKDGRQFFKLLGDGNLPEVYSIFLSNMDSGFSKIKCTKKASAQVANILYFLNIDVPIEIVD